MFDAEETAFVSTAGVGVYAVSVTVSQSVWFIANAVAVVLLPRLTGADASDAARTTPLVCRSTLFVSALAALALGVASLWLIEALFGDDFESAVEPLLWLLPGTVALAGSKILTSYIFSQGHPLTNSLITVAALAVTLAADFALIPPFGVAGAAVASSLAYGVHFALSLAAYRRLSGGSIWEAVVVRGDSRRVIEQLTGHRKADDDHLRRLRDEAWQLLGDFKRYRLVWQSPEDTQAILGEISNL